MDPHPLAETDRVIRTDAPDLLMEILDQVRAGALAHK